VHTRVRRLRTARSAQALDASAVRSGRSTPHACRERTTTVVSALVQACCHQGARLNTRRKAAEHRERTVSRPHPQSNARTGGAVGRGSARARVRRAAAAAWDTSRCIAPRCRCVRAQRARTGAERGACARQGQCTPRERARRRANNGALGKGTHTPVSRARAACGGQRRAGGSAGWAVD